MRTDCLRERRDHKPAFPKNGRKPTGWRPYRVEGGQWNPTGLRSKTSQRGILINGKKGSRRLPLGNDIQMVDTFEVGLFPAKKDFPRDREKARCVEKSFRGSLPTRVCGKRGLNPSIKKLQPHQFRCAKLSNHPRAPRGQHQPNMILPVEEVFFCGLRRKGVLPPKKSGSPV